MRFSVLGRLQVISDEGAELRIPQARQRALLAVLLLHANQAMSVSRLTESVSEEAGPALSPGGLRTQIWALRRLLAPAQRLRAGDYGGYQLEVLPGELDAAEFRRLAGLGRDSLGAGDRAGAVSSLRQALALWGEPPLADVPATLAMGPVAQRLLGERRAARELLNQARLDLGQHTDLIPELREGTAAEPASERLWEQLMLALHRAGRTAEALAAYQQARAVMKDELGLDPGPGLQQLQRRILASDPVLAHNPELASDPEPAKGEQAAERRPAPVRTGSPPRQLPHPVPGFVGRAAELGELTALLDAWAAERHATMIAAVSGPAGVGKTTLAVHWAHQAAGSFPDGQVYLNLNGFGPAGSPMTQEDAVWRVLEAIQVPPARIPASLDGRVGLYRTLLAARRMLILLDNARDAGQVRPLLPGGTGSMVLITSRSALAGLVALDGARTIPLSVLSGPEARHLVARRLGPGRAAADPAATDQLIDACARLPLALAIATALIATRPAQPLTRAVGSLTSATGRLDFLNTGEPTTDLRAVFDWSYQALSKPAATLFLGLAEHPGPDIGAAAAASLVGLPPARIRGTLTELTDLNLIEEHAPGRFAFHDLLRLYATEMLARAGDRAGRQAAGRRMLDHYLHTAWSAALAISPRRSPADLTPAAGGVTPEELADASAATAWLQAEHRVLTRVIGYAAEHGFDVHAWQLAWALTDFLDRGGHWSDFAASQRIALAAAERLGDVTAQAHVHRYLGRACFLRQDYDGALRHFGRAIELRRQLGDVISEAGINVDLCNVHERRGDLDAAVDCARRGLALYQSVPYGIGEVHAHNSLGYYLGLRGDYAEALGHCTRALELGRELGYQGAEGLTWHSLGTVRQHLGQPDQAIACHRRALEIFRALMDRRAAATVLADLGEACLVVDDRPAARRAWQEALDILDDLGHPDADQLRDRLAGIGPVS